MRLLCIINWPKQEVLLALHQFRWLFLLKKLDINRNNFRFLSRIPYIFVTKLQSYTPDILISKFKSMVCSKMNICHMCDAMTSHKKWREKSLTPSYWPLNRKRKKWPLSNFSHLRQININHLLFQDCIQSLSNEAHAFVRLRTFFYL